MRAVMSAHSGSSMALWSANGTFSRMLFVQSLSKARPAAVFALEGQHPIQTALKTFVARLRIVRRNLAQGQQHHRGVVHVRIPFILIFENPAARLDIGRVLVLPIAAETDFLVHQPLHAACSSAGWSAGHAGFVQADRDDGACPTPARNTARCARCLPSRARAFSIRARRA